MVASGEFEEAMRQVENDPNQKALLMIQALDQIALDPRASMSDFVIHDGTSTCVFISFARFDNFIGQFDLPSDSPQLEPLMQAINKNLSSRMFKAAKLLKRMDIRRSRLLHQVAKRASAAAQQVFFTLTADCHPDERRSLMKAAYDAVYQPRFSQLLERSWKVEQVANPGFQGGYHEAVARFLCRHLPLHRSGSA